MRTPPSFYPIQDAAYPTEKNKPRSHHSKGKTHSSLPGRPGHGADAAAGESASDDGDQPHRFSAVAAARATAVAPSDLETLANCEGRPPATRWASSEKEARGMEGGSTARRVSFEEL